VLILSFDPFLKAILGGESGTENFAPYWFGWDGRQCLGHDNRSLIGGSFCLFILLQIHNRFC